MYDNESNILSKRVEGKKYSGASFQRAVVGVKRYGVCVIAHPGAGAVNGLPVGMVLAAHGRSRYRSGICRNADEVHRRKPCMNESGNTALARLFVWGGFFIFI